MLSLYLIGYIVLVVNFIPDELKKQGQNQNNPKEIEMEECSSPQKTKEELKQGSIQKELFGRQEVNRVKLFEKQDLVIEQVEQLNVNMITVWLLPGVALNVLAYGFIKAVNSFIMGWLVYYLLQLDLGSISVLITLLWSVSVFLGGIVSAAYNKNYSKPIFLVQLFLTLVCFFFLDSFHDKMYEGKIVFFLILGGFVYGGPYNLMSTAIPIVLGTQK